MFVLFFSEKLKSIQLVLGEYDMYNYREEFPEHTAKIRRKVESIQFMLFSDGNSIRVSRAAKGANSSLAIEQKYVHYP